MDKDFIKAVEDGLKEIEDGRSVPLEDVKKIMETWGKEVDFDAT